MTTFTWSPYQQAVFDFVEKETGNAIVIAVAGAGKSTTLVEAARRMVGNVAIAAFNKKAGDELAAKARESGCDNKVRCGTFHSFGFRALRYWLEKRGFRVEVDGKKIDRLVDAAVEVKVAGLDDDRAEVVRERAETYRPFVKAAVSMAKQRGIGALVSIDDDRAWFDMVYQFGLDEDLPETDDALAEGIRCARWVLRKNNEQPSDKSVPFVVDFDDMIYLVLAWNVFVLQNEWVLVDEAQDTNPARRALARKMLKPGGRLIAVGDHRQAIYGFTGADNDALDQIRRAFDARELPLTVSYRCPRAVVEYARYWADHIEAFDGAPEGKVSSRTLELHAERRGDELFVEDRIYCEDKSLSRVAFNDFLPSDAVLCRNNAPLVELAFGLIRRGVACQIEGRDIGRGLIALIRKWKVASLGKLRERLESYEDREVRKALAKGQEERADRISDRVQTLLVLLEKAREEKRDVDGLVEMIESMFADGVAGKGILTLSSVHKAKGLEWDRVFLLDRGKYMPSPFARQDWQQEQETNLIYVAVTRAKRELVELSSGG